MVGLEVRYLHLNSGKRSHGKTWMDKEDSYEVLLIILSDYTCSSYSSFFTDGENDDNSGCSIYNMLVAT